MTDHSWEIFLPSIIWAVFVRSIIWERRLKVRFFLGKVFERSTIWKTFLMSERLGGFCKFHQPSGIFSWDASFGTALARSSFFGGGLNPKPSSLRFFLLFCWAFSAWKWGLFWPFGFAGNHLPKLPKFFAAGPWKQSRLSFLQSLKCSCCWVIFKKREIT